MIPAAQLSRLRQWARLILFLACFPALGSSNSTWFTRVWNTDDGLLNDQVGAIVQTRDNYLWVIPPAGLMRFDGVRFTRFPLEDFTSPNDIRISAALSSRTGVLWIATYGGNVLGLKPDFSTIKIPRTDLPKSRLFALAEDKDGVLWIGFANAICRVNDGHIIRFGAKEGIPSGQFHTLICDGEDNIWLAKGNSICVFRDGQFERIATVPELRCLTARSTNTVWVAAGTHLWNCDTNGALTDDGAIPGLSRPTEEVLLEDRTGAVWIGTGDNGLVRYGRYGFERVATSYPSILSLAQDCEGNLWVGTDGGGLDRVSHSVAHLETLENKPIVEQVDSICQDTRGGLWGTAYNDWLGQGLLVSRVDGKWIQVVTNAPFAETVTCAAADDRGTVWIGTQDGNLLRLADSNNPTLVQNTLHGAINTLLPTSNGDLWIVSYSTLQCLRDGQLREVKLPRKVSKISAIAEDAGGNIWVAAYDTVMCFDGNKFVDETPLLPIAGHRVCCIYGTPDGSVWISGGGLGLLRFKNGHADQIGIEQGLFDDYISQIVADGCGWLWFGADHGIFKVRQQELEQAINDRSFHLRPVVYGRNEGLSSVAAIFSTGSPFAFPRALRATDGQVWLLTHTGIVVADAKFLPENSPPPALVSRVTMDGQAIASYGGVVSTQMVANLQTLNVPLRVPPSHRHLAFDYTAFHFSAPESLNFRYQLAGFDNGWIDGETERHADYSRLPAGTYQFKVEACVGDGPWSGTPATVAFTVMPFFWQTWWFRLGALLLFTSSGVAIVRYISFRRLQVKMRQLEQRAALDRERTRIARDLHDDLGCSLNKIALTMEMMQQDQQGSATPGPTIQHCWNMVRDAAGSVDEIVWAINPRNDTLRYMVDYISQFAVEFLQAADVSCLMDLPDNIPDQMVSPEARHNLLLVVKEALNNVIRHAKASEVRVRITVAENQLGITIEDNGCGFERPPDNATCDGLRNMHQRMEEINGQFELTSKPGAGTTVMLSMQS